MTTRVLVLLLLALTAGCSYFLPPDADMSKSVPTELTNYEFGVAYPLRVGTHCGVQSVTIDGEMWVPDEPAGRQDGNLGFNATDGLIVVSDADEAVWTASNGLKFGLHPFVEGRDDPPFPCM